MLIFHDNARNINFVTIFNFLLFKNYRFTVDQWHSALAPTLSTLMTTIALWTFRHQGTLYSLLSRGY